MAGRRRWRWVVSLVICLVAVAHVPATRYVGVNTVVTEERLPLWLKTVNFVDRHANLARWSHAVLGEIDGDEARALRALAWTHARISPTPSTLPSIDDHVWYTVVRGYGEADQAADVFTTLLVYAGVPAFWTLAGARPNELPLSYVQIGGEWRVFDVARNLAFRRADGSLATASELMNPEFVRRAAVAAVNDEDDYLKYFEGYGPPHPPDVLRAELHMPARRLQFAIKSVFGVQGRVWEIRPQQLHQQGDRQ